MLTTKLSIQEKHLNIAKLKKELEAGNVNDDAVEGIIESVNCNLKVMTRKSNYYKSLNHCHKVSKIGISKLTISNKVVGDEFVVKRPDFLKFVLHSNELTPIVVDNAVIEIISPVLKEGNYKWRGIYNGEPISFSMIDRVFKHDVLNKKISFQHGTTIECVLKCYRILDEIGNVVIKGYSVETVLSNINGTNTMETVQGKRYKFNKEQSESQQNLFYDESK